MVTVITDVRIPADAFPLGRVLRAHPDVEIEVEDLVPTRDAVLPLFWVDTHSGSAVEGSLRDDPLVEAIATLLEIDGRVLYSVRWRPELDGFLDILRSNAVDVLGASGTADHWAFRLQFRRRSDLDRLRWDCRDHGIDLDLRELYNPQMPDERGPLTADQHDVLETAFENGYWDSPRRITQHELADLIGLSHTTLSARLRTAERTVVEQQRFGPAGVPYDRLALRSRSG